MASATVGGGWATMEALWGIGDGAGVRRLLGGHKKLKRTLIILNIEFYTLLSSLICIKGSLQKEWWL